MTFKLFVASDKEDNSSVSLQYDFNRADAEAQSKSQVTVSRLGDCNEIYIKIENHDLQFDHPMSKVKVGENEEKSPEKVETSFADQQWEISRRQGVNDLSLIGQILPENHLNVQSHESANTTQNQSFKSGTPNSLNPYKVLPPVTPTGSVTANHLTQDDFLLPPGSAMSGLSGMSGLSPFQGFSPIGSTFVSPRHSAKSNSRSLYSAARKRTLSVSPLSMDGIDLNALIRISPNSLLTTGSLNASPLPPISNSAADHSSTYGHLGARNLTPSSGSLSRNLLAATPASTVMQMDYPALSSSDFYMGGAYENVLSYHHNNSNTKNLAESNYRNRTQLQSSAKPALQHPEISMNQAQTDQKELYQRLQCYEPLPSSVHNQGSIPSSKPNRIPSHELSNNSDFVEHPPPHASRPDSKINSVAPDNYYPSSQKTSLAKTEIRNNIGNINSSQKGTTWICLWLDCNSIFKVVVSV